MVKLVDTLDAVGVSITLPKPCRLARPTKGGSWQVSQAENLYIAKPLGAR